MDEERKPYLYEGLQRRLGGYPVDDFVRAYAKAYLEADVETIRKLQQFLLGKDLLLDDDMGSGGPDALVGAPLKPRPNLNAGAIALPEPEPAESDQ
jgi:hypothetical protein